MLRKNHAVFVGKKYRFPRGGGGINIRFRPKYRPLLWIARRKTLKTFLPIASKNTASGLVKMAGVECSYPVEAESHLIEEIDQPTETVVFSLQPTHRWEAMKQHIATESIESFIDDQAFLLSYGLAPTPPPTPHPVSKLSHFLSLPECRRSSVLTGGGGKGWERSHHTMARNHGPL